MLSSDAPIKSEKLNNKLQPASNQHYSFKSHHEQKSYFMCLDLRNIYNSDFFG